MKYNFLLLIVLVLFISGCSDVSTNNTTNDTNNNPVANTKDLKEVFADRATKYTGEYTISAYEAMQDLTQVYDLPKYAIMMNLGDSETRTIFDGKQMVHCNHVDNIWYCTNTSTQLSESLQLEQDINEGKAKYAIIGTCNFAKEFGTKYNITLKNGASSQVCYTNDGILLEMYSPPEYYIVAKKITRSINSSAFVLPTLTRIPIGD